MEVLRAFVEHKEQIHEEVDPASLKPISKVFDLRWWGILFLEHADENNTTLQNSFEKEIQKWLADGKDFIQGEDVENLLKEIKLVIKKVCKYPALLKSAQKQSIVKAQWNVMKMNPALQDLGNLNQALIRVSLAPNSKAGCEQSNSKYYRAKNKYNSTMQIPMIQARMRVGPNINGPPLHQFQCDNVLQYWVDNSPILDQRGLTQSE